MKRNSYFSKIHLLSIAFLLISCLTTIKADGQNCGLTSNFSYYVPTSTNVNFQDLSIDSSTSSGFTTTTLNLSTGSKAPTDIITGDFNLDGKLDIINTDSGSNNITEFLGTGAGAFSAAVSFPTGGTGPVTVVSGDFNGDGAPDLAIVNEASNNISIMLGHGNGTFSTATIYNAGTNPYKIVTADFNGDGKPDLAISNTGSNTISLLLGNGDGTFTSGNPLATGSGTSPKSMATADFNGDGKADLAVVNTGTNTFDIFLGNGTGGFSLSSGSPFGTGVNTSWAIVSGDFNGDGKPDLALPDCSNINTSVYLNNNDGTGNLTYGFKYNQTGMGAKSIATGDINGDGNLDLIVPITNVNALNILYGKGNGTFGGSSILTTGYRAYAPVTGDFNGDGKTDIALTNESSGNIYVYLNSPASTITSWHWYFGDGDTSNLQNPTHTYASTDSFVVCLTVTSSIGCTDQYCQEISPSQTLNLGQISPATSIVCSGRTQSLTVTGATGNNYQWEMSTDNTNWTNIPGATDTTYAAASTSGSTFYRLTNQSGIVLSTTAEVDLSHPVITINTINITSQSVVLNWTPKGNGNYSVSYTGASAGTLTGVTPPETITGLTANGTYNITVTQTGLPGCPASGTIAVVTIKTNNCSGGFAVTPRDTICTGTTGNLLINTNDTSIQWQSSVDDINFANITGATKTGYKTLPLQQTTWYRAKVDSSTCSAFSNAVKLYVPFPLITYFSLTQTGIDQFTFNSDSSAGNIYAYHWDFGDGNTSNMKNPVHKYTSDSNYYVCLTIYDASNCSYTYCRNVTSQNKNCKLTAQYSYTLNDSSGLATFQDLSIDSTQGASINSWSWDFNSFNGTSTLQNPSFTFPVDSNYHVCLTVTNTAGCSNSYCQYILVHKITGPCNITPQFSYTSDSTGLGTFIDLSTDSVGTIDSWHWSFGDVGSPSDDAYTQNATHAFTTSSIYNVCLTMGNSLGCDSTICKQVPITSTISSLCVSVFPQDSNLITQTSQQSEEYYLIKEFNTANGDSLALIDTFTINSSLDTYHCFTALRNGTYYVKAAFMPGSAEYLNYFPSYYNGVLLWNNATPLNLNGSQYISLMLLKGTNTGGPGFIGGYVSQGANRLEQGASTNAVGDPEPGKTVILTSGSGNPVGHTLTDAQGHFQFTNLAFGMYYLAVDELNKPCTPLEVTIDDSTGYRESANFQLNSKSVSSQIALSTYTVLQHPFKVQLMGNPVGDELILYLQNMNSDALITVTDLLGRELVTDNAAQQSTLVKLNVQNLASGIYMVTVKSGSDLKTIKFAKE